MPYRAHTAHADHDLSGYLVFLLPNDPEPATWLLRADCTVIDGARLYLVSAPGAGETTTRSTVGDVMMVGEGDVRDGVVGDGLDVAGRPAARAVECVAATGDWSAWRLY